MNSRPWLLKPHPANPSTIDEALARVGEKIEADEELRQSVRVLAGWLQESHHEDALNTLRPSESTLNREQGLHWSGIADGIAVLCSQLTEAGEIANSRAYLREEQGEKE